MKEHTPVMRHYLALKEQYPDALLMYQMGDFYEFFFEDAQQASDILNIALTSRGESAAQKIKMAGIPVHAKDNYLGKLIQAGHTVVVCAQLNNSATAGKMPIQRAITQIITPGTLTDPSLLQDKSDTILMSLYPHSAEQLGVAWASLTQGKAYFRALSAKECIDFLERIHPAEIITTAEGAHYIPTHHLCTIAKAHLFSEDLSLHLSHLPHLSVYALFGKDKTHPAYTALALLLAYARETQRHAPSFITSITEEKESAYLSIDARTRLHLDISTARGQSQHTLFSLLDECRTKGGSRLLRHLLHHPYREASLAQEKQAALTYLSSHLLTQAEVRSALDRSLRALKDCERIASRIALGQVRAHELCGLRDTLEIVIMLQTQLQPLFQQQSYLAELCTGLSVPDTLIHCLRRALPSTDALETREPQSIATGYHPQLDALRAQYDLQYQAILDLEQQEKERSGLHTLRIHFNRVHGYYIELSSVAAKSAPADYQPLQSLKNVSRFTLPALKAREKEILYIREHIQQQESQLYSALINELSIYVPVLRCLAERLAQLDLLFSHACFAERHHYICPELTSTPHIRIEEGRHPVVEAKHTDFIPNETLSTQTQAFTLITGPNMGGKSTYMRQTALIVLMSYCGLFVPAEKASIGPIDAIFTRIGASDDIAAGQSTFMVEMIESAYILDKATEHSLVIMDEIGRGTSTYDGVSLAYAIAQTLIDRGCHTLFSTHYHELSQAFAHEPRCQHRYCDAIEHNERLIFTHRMKKGISTNSYGLHVAKLAGLPPSTLETAAQFLSHLHQTAG